MSEGPEPRWTSIFCYSIFLFAFYVFSCEAEVQLSFQQSDEYQDWRQTFFQNWRQKISIIFDSNTFYRYFRTFKIETIDFLPLIGWKLALAGARSYISWKLLKIEFFMKENWNDGFFLLWNRIFTISKKAIVARLEARRFVFFSTYRTPWFKRKSFTYPENVCKCHKNI